MHKAWAILNSATITLALAGLLLPSAGSTSNQARGQNAADQDPAAPPAGLWLSANKDGQNSSRADLPANIKQQPREIWRYGAEAFAPDSIQAIDIAGEPCLLVQSGWQMRLLRRDGSSIWPQAITGPRQVLAIWSTPAGQRIVARWGQSGVVLLDAASGKTLWRRLFDNGFVGAIPMPQADGFRLFIAPGNSTKCLCLQWDRSAAGEPQVLWEQDYAGKYLPNFGPLLAGADMDNDGRPDLVLVSKPSYVAVIDGDSGRIKFDLKYAVTGGPADTGRPYGMVQLVDLDGDGLLDVVIAGYRVEEYLAVVKNEGGQALRALWSRFVEKDFPEDHRELRPSGTSVADLNGDGKPELVVSLFNMQGDQRWHTLVLDPLAGDAQPLQDWPDRYLWGCFRLEPGKLPQVIVSAAPQRKLEGATLLEARDGGSGQVIATVENAALLTRQIESTAPTPYPGAHYAERREPIYLRDPSGQAGLLLEGDKLWHLHAGRSQFTDLAISKVSRLVMGGLPVAAEPDATPLDLHLQRLEDAAGPAALATLVGQASASGAGKVRELIICQADGAIVGGVPDLSAAGKWKARWNVAGVEPSLWLGPDGRRVLCALDPRADAVLLYRDPGADAAAPPRRIDLPLPPQRRSAGRGRPLLLPFTVGGEMRLFVSLASGRDTTAAALYDEQGKLLWLDREHGPYPQPPAVYDLDGDAVPELLVDDHGRQAIYRLDGHSTLFAQAWHNTVPGRANGTAYALPMPGPLGPDGGVRLLLAPGLCAHEVCDGRGQRLLHRAYPGIYDYSLARPALGRRAGKQWDMGIVHRNGTFERIDTANLQVRATVNLGQPLLPGALVIACDLDGDGSDEFIVGLAGGQVLAIGESAVLWSLDLHAQLHDLIAADVDGDGFCELIITTGDGCTRIFR